MLFKKPKCGTLCSTRGAISICNVKRGGKKTKCRRRHILARIQIEFCNKYKSTQGTASHNRATIKQLAGMLFAKYCVYATHASNKAGPQSCLGRPKHLQTNLPTIWQLTKLHLPLPPPHSTPLFLSHFLLLLQRNN